MDLLILKQEDMKQVFRMEDAIRADKDALALYSSGGSNIPLRVNLDVPEHEGQSLYMPGYAAQADALGVKIVSVYPHNIEKGLTSVPATMVLVNNETGEVCSLMDGTYLTRVRTGAVSGAATDLLARRDASVFALFGTGGQAETQLEAVLTVRPIREVRVFDISHERAEAFAQRMTQQFAGRFPAVIRAAASSAEAINSADVITCVTTSHQPVFDGTLVKKGAHINGVGAYTPEMQEIDEYALLHAGKVYVDTRNGVLNEAGDLIKPIARGVFSADRVTGELGELILGRTPGRTSDDELTIFKTTGTAVLDIVTARRIYEAALQKGIGTVVAF